ncbi:glycerophosphodiester phosphodiesterase [Flavobacterium gawalongense]|uniref:Glycerophosphodiester phosphodiesterase n=1 Tax=Flavobacterium gawalongense TaxID=2594432 RepID=A0A553BU85_9FLAO|nr:glycerophosphodiester phosphodiesterase family protein [Flavobacterium gawalongense]TRX02487.1 glycerophosphodiester phosphodiesterase [Flavobacterium gawalongense]TRX07685.1 glycerophosphodiester phosphodiesterase [Flavobacterium gawalongense]TRX11814.1 glycerophosphodiester phosphodiesterase [Flavobacterium gawalongense]TRX12994.1 glycerophosphodiester phosphodiesterase [Flavobacterium gawalongense]TRX31038.1 glycerophosphodiester phosphodiesterase [Flavobacterium gawalongense]
MLKIGHRGAKGYGPENTLISFQKALDMQVDGIELDVHLSADGELMVIHDETVDRTTNGKGFVNKLSLQELKAFRINGKHQIPTLKEVVDLVNQYCFINIELKNYDTAEKVVSLIEKYVAKKNWKYDCFLVSSFDWNALQQVAFLNDKIPIGVLTETDLELAMAFAKFIQAKSIHPHFHLLTKENTAQMQEKGLQVFPWTINESEDIQKIKTFNVNGIITDFPNRI